jgi:hypothetical protein
MHVTPHDLFTSLLIGCEVFAIAALWPLSEWAATRHRRLGLLAALLAIAACVALDTHGLAFPVLRPDSLRWAIAHAVEWTTLPLFIAFPDAVCVASAQSLVHAGVSVRSARLAALLMGLLAAMVAPVAAIVTDCGLAGACF